MAPHQPNRDGDIEYQPVRKDNFEESPEQDTEPFGLRTGHTDMPILKRVCSWSFLALLLFAMLWLFAWTPREEPTPSLQEDQPSFMQSWEHNLKFSPPTRRRRQQRPTTEALTVRGQPSLIVDAAQYEASWDGLMPISAFVDWWASDPTAFDAIEHEAFVAASTAKTESEVGSFDKLARREVATQFGFLPQMDSERSCDPEKEPRSWQTQTNAPWDELNERWQTGEFVAVRVLQQLTEPLLIQLQKRKLIDHCALRFRNMSLPAKPWEEVSAMSFAAFTPHADRWRQGKRTYWQDSQSVCVFDRLAFADALRSMVLSGSDGPHVVIRTQQDAEAKVPLNATLFVDGPKSPLLLPEKPAAATAAVVPKLYKFSPSIALWLRHMLEKLRFDYVVFYIVSSVISLDDFELQLCAALDGAPDSTYSEHTCSMSSRGLLKRVLTLDWYMHSSPRAHYTYAVESAAWDATLRFRKTFDVVHIVDTDEFLTARTGGNDVVRIASVSELVEERLPLRQHALAVPRLAVVCSRVEDGDFVQCTPQEFRQCSEFMTRDDTLLRLLGPDTSEELVQQKRRCMHTFGKSLFRPTLEHHPYLHFSMLTVQHEDFVGMCEATAPAYERALRTESGTAVVLHVRNSLPEGYVDFDTHACTCADWQALLHARA